MPDARKNAARIRARTPSDRSTGGADDEFALVYLGRRQQTQQIGRDRGIHPLCLRVTTMPACRPEVSRNATPYLAVISRLAGITPNPAVSGCGADPGISDSHRQHAERARMGDQPCAQASTLPVIRILQPALRNSCHP